MAAAVSALPLQNRVIIITGAGCGIGKELARTLANNGAKIVAVDLDAARAKGAIEGLTNCRFTVCDPDDEYSRRLLVEETIAKWGRVDAVIDSAALICAGPLDSIDAAA